MILTTEPKMNPGAAFRNEPTLDYDDPRNQVAIAAALRTVRGRLGTTYPLIIGGREVARGRTFASRNPANWAEVIGHHAVAEKADVDAALDSAWEAFPAWARTPAADRADVLFRAAAIIRERRNELSALLMLEVGKVWDEADGEVAEAVDLLTWYGQQMLKLEGAQQLTPVEGESADFFYVPLGAGVIVSPWNFPLALTVGMLSAAIVAGNTALVKPSSNSPTTVAWLVDILREAGTPAGVVNYLTGSGSELGTPLIEDRRVRFIAFTGSRDVGLEIYERAGRTPKGQRWLKRVQLEMGGKNAVVVDETADLDKAADAIVISAFGFQGQKCSAGSRAVIVEQVYDKILAKVIERAKELVVGDPTDPATNVGPVIDPSAQQKILRYIEIGRNEGRLVLGGNAKGEGFIEPTIIADVAPEARIAQEEIFGPVLALIRARDFAHAIEIANGTEYGLTGAFFSRDPQRIEEARRSFHVGNLYINRKCTGALMGVHPFGGFNMSGTDSKAGGPDYLLFFLQGKAVGTRLN
jgi:1-pyrroline-5-carboxylate dehydrogenase